MFPSNCPFEFGFLDSFCLLWTTRTTKPLAFFLYISHSNSSLSLLLPPFVFPRSNQTHQPEKRRNFNLFLEFQERKRSSRKMLAIGSPNYSVRTSTSCNALLRELQVFPLFSLLLFFGFLLLLSFEFFLFDIMMCFLRQFIIIIIFAVCMSKRQKHWLFYIYRHIIMGLVQVSLPVKWIRLSFRLLN